jgi:transcriptional regulator
VAHLRRLDENRGHGDALLAVAEARLPKQPWDLAQMEPDKRESMLAAIRVIDLVVDQIEGRRSSTSTRAMRTMSRSTGYLARSAETWPPPAGAEDAGAAAGAWV